MLRVPEAKNQSNFAKHGLDFADAKQVLTGPYVSFVDDWPPAKEQLSIRLDADVLNWLKSKGRGYQTRINRILRAAMDSQPPMRGKAT